MGFVYFIAMGDWIKIGKADDVKARMATLQSASPIQLHLIASIPSMQPFELESKLHKTLAQYRVGGDWFEMPDNVLREVIQKIWHD